MADFEAPPSPPPPKVPEGWLARWNEQYKEWFYVNSYTKKSQWDKPTEPAVPPRDDLQPPGPPPSYTPGDHKPAAADAKVSSPHGGNHSRDTYAGAAPSSGTEHDDARLARQLQAEEDARAGGGGAAASYLAGAASPAAAQQPQAPAAFPSQLPPRPDNGDDKSRGLLGKIFGGKKPGSGFGGGGGYQQQPPLPQGYGYASPAPQQPAAGAYGAYTPPLPAAAAYYPPPAQYGAPYGGGYAPPPQQQQQPQAYAQQGTKRPGGGGMGMALGGAALGLGAGVVGSMLIGNAIEHEREEAYEDGFGDGADYGGDGGDYGDF